MEWQTIRDYVFACWIGFSTVWTLLDLWRLAVELIVDRRILPPPPEQK